MKGKIVVGHVIASLIRFDKPKINLWKGIRQGLLMIIPTLIGYLLGHFSFGLLVATGTLAHTYVFKGSAQSMLRTVIICTLSFTICMMLGTLTVNQPVLYGVLLLIVTVIPFYVFNVLKIAGPSSTFFLVTFCLSSNLPDAPEQAPIRGLAIFIGGMLATLVVILTIVFQKQKAEDRAITSDFQTINNLMHHFNDAEKFKDISQDTVTKFKNSEKLLITSTTAMSEKLSSRFEKLLLLHTSAQGIYAELLELNEKNIRPIPQELIEMMDMITRNAYKLSSKREKWTKKVDVDEPFESLMQHILKIDEIAQLQPEQIESEASIRKPLYSKRIVQNLTLDCINVCCYYGRSYFCLVIFQYPTFILDSIIRPYSIIRINDDSDVRPFISTWSWNNCRDFTSISHTLFPTSFNCRSHFNGAVCYDDRRICRSKLCVCSYFYYNTSHPVKWFSLW